MPLCVSLKADGARCTRNGIRRHDGMCGTHHNQKMRQDPAYAARFASESVAPAPRPPAPHAPANQAQRQFYALRTDVLSVRDDLQHLMNTNSDSLGLLISNELKAKSVKLNDINRRMQTLYDTINEELEAQLRTELHRLRRYVFLARRATRDPRLRDDLEGSITYAIASARSYDSYKQLNLGIIARNTGVPLSDVESAVQQGLGKILALPAPTHDQDTLSEITEAFRIINWQAPNSYEAVIEQLNTNFTLSADYTFGVKYSRALDHIWAYIKAHAERDELTRRLAEELIDGRGKCSHGKMLRLLNVLQGYDGFTIQMAPSREQFQTKIAALASRRVDERRDAAMALFDEFKIPEAEHDAWLEPLLDA